MKKLKNGILIGKVAARTGLAVSAIRFYEEAGLVSAGRNRGGQRVFEPADIRRISFIIIAYEIWGAFSNAGAKRPFLILFLR